MTVPHGLRSSWEREEARRTLIDEAVATTDGRRFLELLRGVEDRWEFDLVAELLAVHLATSPLRIEHRPAKRQALARERVRRRSEPVS